MIYLLVEDSTNGLKICEEVIDIYFSNNSDVDVRSIHGIPNLANSLENLFATFDLRTDTAVVVFDDIMENPIVGRAIEDADEFIQKFGENIKFIGTESFEIEILSILGIEYWANIANYNKYAKIIRDSNENINKMSYLTDWTKKCDIYTEFYNKARLEKKKRRLYQSLTPSEFEMAITIETISKDIMKEVFRDASIDKPMTDCWRVDCCCRPKKPCINGSIDFNKIRTFQTQYNKYKTRYLILNTSYGKIINCLDMIMGNKRKLEDISIISMLDDKLMTGEV